MIVKQNEKPEFDEVLEVTALSSHPSSKKMGGLAYNMTIQGAPGILDKVNTERVNKGLPPIDESQFVYGVDDIKPTLESETDKILDESSIAAEMRKLKDEGRQETVEYQKLKSLLDFRQLMFIAYKINDPETLTEEVPVWAKAFTEKSIEIYGRPDPELSKDLLFDQVASFHDSDITNTDEYREFVRISESIGLPVGEFDPDNRIEPGYKEKYKEASKQVAKHLREKCGDLFEIMGCGEGFDKNEKVNIRIVADRLENAIAKLAEADPSFADWSVTRDVNKNQFNVRSAKLDIVVGMLRDDMKLAEVEALISHEILRHLLVGNNGRKLKANPDEKLPLAQIGLPNYLAWEEGSGVFYEYALSGVIPEKIADRYLDISIALGDFTDGMPVSRTKLTKFNIARAKLRNLSLPESERKTDEAIEKDVTTHVTRIYRGTDGTDEDGRVGVFVKDYVYLGGFPEVGQYIADNLAEGKSIEEIIEYITQGKFNPTMSAHENYIADRTSIPHNG